MMQHRLPIFVEDLQKQELVYEVLIRGTKSVETLHYYALVAENKQREASRVFPLDYGELLYRVGELIRDGAISYNLLLLVTSRPNLYVNNLSDNFQICSDIYKPKLSVLFTLLDSICASLRNTQTDVVVSDSIVQGSIPLSGEPSTIQKGAGPIYFSCTKGD